MMSEHGLDPHAMVGAYVADALDDAERTAFEQHLTGCEGCRREVAEFGETAAALTALAQIVPPPSLRASVLAEIATVRPLPPVGDPPATSPASSSLVEPVAVPAVDELAVRRGRRLRRALICVVAAAVVLVLALGGWVGALVSDQRQQQIASQQVSELLTAPDAKVYTTQLNGSPVSYVVSRERNQVLFLGNDVSAPPSDRVYQLWMLRPGDVAEPNATVDHGGSVATWLTGSLGNAQGLAVTVEPKGGSAQPTTDPVAVVQL